uniref:Uncharacterized protein n=1 Tax=Arundo donax TaxID=35708 RepID=A0A0A9AVU2_ARUDO
MPGCTLERKYHENSKPSALPDCKLFV